jgi:hypothetical protein
MYCADILNKFTTKSPQYSPLNGELILYKIFISLPQNYWIHCTLPAVWAKGLRSRCQAWGQNFWGGGVHIKISIWSDKQAQPEIGQSAGSQLGGAGNSLAMTWAPDGQTTRRSALRHNAKDVGNSSRSCAWWKDDISFQVCSKYHRSSHVHGFLVPKFDLVFHGLSCINPWLLILNLLGDIWVHQKIKPQQISCRWLFHISRSGQAWTVQLVPHCILYSLKDDEP